MSAETRRIREAVFKRAENICEACHDEAAMAMDHFFGRAKAPQSAANCWALCCDCDFRKTYNRPSSAHWQRLFIAHTEKHGYETEAARARDRLAFVEARTQLVTR